MAMLSCKPMFFLKTAEGAIGSHATAAQNCFGDFNRLATAILTRL